MDLDNEELEKTKKNHFNTEKLNKDKNFEIKIGSRGYERVTGSFENYIRFIFNRCNKETIEPWYLEMSLIMQSEYQMRLKELKGDSTNE